MADELTSARSSGSRTFSCALCYQSKRKCDKAIPCSHCVSKNVECKPSLIETTERPRKRRFPEAELLDRVAKYEAALVSYGADLESIRGCQITEQSPRLQPARSSASLSSTSPEDVTASFIAVVDGEKKSTDGSRSWYDDVFAHDGSSTLFAVDPVDVPLHPPPFDIFKLWQVYRDNIHPISKLLHAPTFQRKISSYGTMLHLAPAADQALFFSVYAAAIASLSAEQCQVTFSTSKDVLLEQYKLAAQVWLRRANIWRTSDLTVLQAFLLFLSSIQHSIDPRTLASFTGVADRIARRMGLHRDSKGASPMDREMRTRVWCEILLLDAKAVERAGLGTSVSTGHWDARLPSTRSDADLESIGEMSSLAMPPTPSSEMICFIVRAEILLFTAELHNERVGRNTNKIDNSTLRRSLDSIKAFEHRLHSQYLCFCDEAVSMHRLTFLFARSALSRLHISAYVVEDSSKAEVGLELLRHCTDNLDLYNKMRSDPLLKPYKWFILQDLPVFAYITMLRLLQQLVSGQIVDRAWRVLEEFKGAGPRQIADSLMLRAWEARKGVASRDGGDDPTLITETRNRLGVQEAFPATDSGASSLATNASLSESEVMALMAEILHSEVYSGVDWPS